MSRAAFARLRPVCAALAVVLAVPFLQPNGAAAQTTPLSKIVCNLSRGGCGTNIGAFPGDTVQYQLSYRNVGNAGTVTIYDQVQPGQTYQTCASPGGSCMFSNTPPPPQVTFTTGAVPVGGTGTVTFNATVTATNGVISDQATAVFPGTSAYPSNTVGVNVLAAGAGPGGGTGTPAAGLSVAKQVRDVTTGSGYATSITANPGDTVQYQVTVTNAGTTTATAVALSDTLQGGQSFVTTSCSTTCTFNGSTVSFSLGNIAGATSSTVTFSAVIGPIRGTTGQVIPNTAAAAGTNTGTATSNSTFVTVGTVTNPSTSPVTNPCPYTCGVPCQYYCGSPCAYSCGAPCATGYTCGTGCGYPYYTCGTPCSSYYGCSGAYPGPFCGSAYCSSPYCPTYYCATPSCPPYCGSASFTPPYCNTTYYSSYCGGPAFTGTTTVCGVIAAYTGPTSTNGSMTLNGITYTIAASVIPTGVAITPGQYYCVTMTVSTAGLVTSLVCAPNVAATNYVCGTMYPYTPTLSYGYSPYPGYLPPSTGAGYGPYPVQSSYGYSTYGFSGPMYVGGYPYPVAAGTYFPYSPAYGNPYCFLTSPSGYVTGSLSVVPTAATAVQDPPHGTHVGKGVEN